LSRFRIVTRRFQNSEHVEETLAWLVEAYLALGFRSEAERMSAELGQRFPDGQWAASARAALQSAPHDPINNVG
jgi:outer membrane protein assembly factor BamD (BamD/ComL family)